MEGCYFQLGVMRECIRSNLDVDACANEIRKKTGWWMGAKIRKTIDGSIGRLCQRFRWQDRAMNF